jgi:phenylacetate-CoA ligase
VTLAHDARVPRCDGIDPRHRRLVEQLELHGRMDPEHRRAHQLAQLQELVAHHHRNNVPYRAMCESRGARPEQLETLDDLRRFPVVERDFLSRWGFFHGAGGALSIPPSELATFLCSSGSTGRPKRVPVSHGTLQSIFETCALAFWLAGFRGHGTPGGGPIYPIYPHGPWPSAFFSQNACEMIAFSPKGEMGMPLEWHLANILDLRPRYLVSSPSFLTLFSQFLASRVDMSSLGIERILLGGEYFSEGYRHEMERRFGARVLDVYGCAETQAVGIEADDLRARLPGTLYQLAQSCLIEIVKPGTEELVRTGEAGEMLVTVFNRIAWPVVRYRIGDIAWLHPEERIAGLSYTFPVMSRIQGRADDMLVYGNANLYPEVFFNSLTVCNQLFSNQRGGVALSPDKFVFEILEDEDDAAGYHARWSVELEQGTPDALDAEARRGAEQAVLDTLLSLSAELRYVVTSGKNVPTPRIELCAAGSLYDGRGKMRRMIDHRRGPRPPLTSEVC